MVINYFAQVEVTREACALSPFCEQSACDEATQSPWQTHKRPPDGVAGHPVTRMKVGQGAAALREVHPIQKMLMHTPLPDPKRAS